MGRVFGMSAQHMKIIALTFLSMSPSTVLIERSSSVLDSIQTKRKKPVGTRDS